jgi:hypothetical protein
MNDSYPIRRFEADSRFDFDWDYRPERYWRSLPDEQSLLANVKGTVRREIAQRVLDGEVIPGVPGSEEYRAAIELILREKLTPEELKLWGRLDPEAMGGEFLPRDLPGEVEIARIELASVTYDVYEVRARPGPDGRIYYRVVDEYWDEGSTFGVSPEVSDAPLTFSIIIDLIDTARQTDPAHVHPDDTYNVGLFDMDREFNYREVEGRHPQELVNFATVRSTFYQTLGKYYEQRAKAWLEEALEELEGLG